MNITHHLPDLRFTLTSDDDHIVTQDDYHTTPVLLYFGFTHCPDECPLMLARLKRVLQQHHAPVHVLFVSVDVQDTPVILHHYLIRYDPKEMTGLTGNPHAIEALARRYRAAYRPANDEGEFAHSNAIYGFDRHGHARILIKPTDSDATILAALEEMNDDAR